MGQREEILSSLLPHPQYPRDQWVSLILLWLDCECLANSGYLCLTGSSFSASSSGSAFRLPFLNFSEYLQQRDSLLWSVIWPHVVINISLEGQLTSFSFMADFSFPCICSIYVVFKNILFWNNIDLEDIKMIAKRDFYTLHSVSLLSASYIIRVQYQD